MGERGGLPEAMRVTGREGLVRDQIRPDCPYDEPCAIWVEGYWGATIEAPGLDFGGPATPTPKRHPFSVRRYLGRVTEAASHVRLVEKS